LKDGPKKNNELKALTHLSAPSLSDNLKRLQKGKKMVTRDVDSRKYIIDNEGLRWLRRNDLADTIKSGLLSEEELMSPPVNSIVAIDVPSMPEAQQRVFMKGTADIAKACFDQFLSDTRKEEGSGNYPSSGRIVYTAAIDLKQARTWLDSEEGKKYLKFWLKEKKP
jgi:hypothetical protein